MVKSERNEPSGTVTPLDGLLSTITAADTPFVPAALKVLLSRLAVFARDVDRRLNELQAEQVAFEARLQYQRGRVDSLPENLRAQLYGLLSVAEREGMLGPVVADAVRPGGPMPGDIESYGGSD